MSSRSQGNGGGPPSSPAGTPPPSTNATSPAITSGTGLFGFAQHAHGLFTSPAAASINQATQQVVTLSGNASTLTKEQLKPAVEAYQNLDDFAIQAFLSLLSLLCSTLLAVYPCLFGEDDLLPLFLIEESCAAAFFVGFPDSIVARYR